MRCANTRPTWQWDDRRGVSFFDAVNQDPPPRRARLDRFSSKISSATRDLSNVHPSAVGRCRWVRSNAFEFFFAVMIIVHSVLLVVETDKRDKHKFEIGWVICDSLFTLLFLVEVVLRVVAYRSRWLRSFWNIFDMLLVLSSIVEVWLLPLINRQFQLRLLLMLRLMRLFRTLGILRLIRLLRYWNQLILLVQALWNGLRALFWAVVLIIIILYVFALVLTRITHMESEGDDDHNALIDEWFGSLPRSLFTLFQLMTMEGWPEVARETLETSPWRTTFYVGFIMLTNITLLNTVAGVLCENVLSISREDKARRAERMERQMELEREAVGEELAQRWDENGDGMLDLRELQAAEASPQQAPHLARFLWLAGLGPEEAEELFHIVDFDGTSTVTYKDFVEVAHKARGPIKAKHILSLQHDIANVNAELIKVESLLETVCARAAGLAAGACGDVSKESTCGREGTDEVVLRSTVAELRRDFFARLKAMEARISLEQMDASAEESVVIEGSFSLHLGAQDRACC